MKRIIFAGIGTCAVCIVMLIITCLIPRSLIKENIRESADYYMSVELFDHVTSRGMATRQDNYSDCILSNIIYCMDSGNIAESIVAAAYYNPQNEEVNVSLSDLVREDGEVTPFLEAGGLKPDYVDYSRYWHGAIVLLQILFLFFPIEGVRFVLGLIVLGLNIWFVSLLFKNDYRIFAVCYILAMSAVSFWMCAFCIEYVLMFLVMGVELPVLFILLNKGKTEGIINLYMVLCAGGIATAFFDFLTTETLTFTMPVLLYLVMREKKGAFWGKKEWTVLLKGGVIWGLSYAFMFSLKWLVSLIILGKDVFVQNLSQAALRINGAATVNNIVDGDKVSRKEQITGALWRNIGCIFQTGNGITRNKSILIAIFLLIIIFSVWYLTHERLNSVSSSFVLMVLAVCLLPYIRFLLLNNHAYIHFFFTYRAQLVTITGLSYLAIKDIPKTFKLKK